MQTTASVESIVRAIRHEIKTGVIPKVQDSRLLLLLEMIDSVLVCLSTREKHLAPVLLAQLQQELHSLQVLEGKPKTANAPAVTDEAAIGLALEAQVTRALLDQDGTQAIDAIRRVVEAEQQRYAEVARLEQSASTSV